MFSTGFQVDAERHRISLGMKNSYLTGDYDIQAPSKPKSDDAISRNDYVEGTQLTTLLESSSSGIQNLDIQCENGDRPVLAKVEERASILPLEVPLDDMENSGLDDDVCKNNEHVDDADTGDEKNKRRAKKKAKEER